MNLIGYTLGHAARTCGFRAKGYRVYMLREEGDSTGVKLAEDYELGRILRLHPELRRCRVASLEDYFGMLIFRVREAEHGGSR